MFLISLRLVLIFHYLNPLFTSTFCTCLQALLLCFHECGYLLFLACTGEILLQHSQSMVLLQKPTSGDAAEVAGYFFHYCCSLSSSASDISVVVFKCP